MPNVSAVTVRADILAAKASGAKEYVFPEGDYVFDGVVYLTDELEDFTIRGEGLVTMSADKQVSTATRSYIFVVGPQITLHNLSGFTNQVRAVLADNPANPTGALADKAEFFTPIASDLSKFAVDDPIVVWDPSGIVHVTNGDTNKYKAELCRVLKIENGNVYFDTPLGRSFVGASVSNMKQSAGRNLRFENIEFDGTVPGNPNTRNDGLVKVDVCDGLVLKGLRVRNFNSRAIVEQFCRNVTVQDCHVYDGANPQQPGSGYGICFVGGRNLRALVCTATNTRHGFIAHNGAMDGQMISCKALGDNGNFDTHGCNELRWSFIDCIGTGSINLGSGAWRGGGRTFTVSGCNFGGAYHHAPFVEDVNFFKTTLTGISSDGGLGRVPFEKCAFLNVPAFGIVYEGDVPFGVYEFTGCTFELGSGNNGVLIDSRKQGGKYVFRQGCTAKMNQTGAYVAIFLSLNGASVEFEPGGLTITNTRTNAKVYALETTANYKGTVTDRGGLTYVSPTFQKLYQDAAGAVRTEGSNQVVYLDPSKVLESTPIGNGQVGRVRLPLKSSVEVGYEFGDLLDPLVGELALQSGDYPDPENVLVNDSTNGVDGRFLPPPTEKVSNDTLFGVDGLTQGLLDPLGDIVYLLEATEATKGDLPPIQRGDTYSHTINGLANMVRADTIMVTAKKPGADYADPHSDFQIVSGEGLRWVSLFSSRKSQGSLENPTPTSLRINLTASATALLKARDLVFDVQIKTGDVVQTIHSGKVSVLADVTRAVA